MILRRSYRSFLFIFLLAPALAVAQDTDYDSLLQRIDTVENPVYKPVISLSYGVLNFRGDVRNSLITPSFGNAAGQVNVATFIDRKHQYFVANFNVLFGSLSVNDYSYSDIARNLNFETRVYSFGMNIEYRFGHLVDKTSLIRPYVSLGIENINFSSKGDLEDSNGRLYNYWSDGTIRDVPDGSPPGTSEILYRDYVYETDLRLRENSEFGLGTYKQHSLGIPAGAGLLFRIHDRAFFSLGITYHYTFTDYLDNVAFEGTSIQGKKGNDGYVYSHIGVNFDLFSDPSTLFFDDEDGDFVLDVSDHCPGTPYGVAVDTLGCPLDGDSDGIPDYLDKEPGTQSGAWVDDNGVTVTEDDFYASLEVRNHPMPRNEVEAYLSTVMSEYRVGRSAEIPEKFVSLDTDGDGYISFDELLISIDQYFDYKLDLSLEEIRELNDFFFSQ